VFGQAGHRRPGALFARPGENERGGIAIMSEMPSEAGGIWARRLGLTLLAALLVFGGYKFYDFSTKSRVAANFHAANGLLQSVGDALTAYQAQAGAYFQPSPEGEPRILDETLINIQFLQNAGIKPYEFSVIDPFAPEPGGPIHYWTDHESWVIWSAGPDGDYDLDKYAVRSASYDTIAAAFESATYDPKKGVLSSGDIYKVYHPVTQAAGQGE
jgi:hypothetical protein